MALWYDSMIEPLVSVLRSGNGPNVVPQETEVCNLGQSFKRDHVRLEHCFFVMLAISFRNIAAIPISFVNLIVDGLTRHRLIAHK